MSSFLLLDTFFCIPSILLFLLSKNVSACFEFFFRVFIFTYPLFSWMWKSCQTHIGTASGISSQISIFSEPLVLSLYSDSDPSLAALKKTWVHISYIQLPIGAKFRGFCLESDNSTLFYHIIFIISHTAY